MMNTVQQMSSFEFQMVCVVRLLLASVCGFAIGIERTNRLKDAGMRTHLIVCMGAALMMLVSKYGFFDVSTLTEFFKADVSRVASSVVAGIGFLGAGHHLCAQSQHHGPDHGRRHLDHRRHRHGHGRGDVSHCRGRYHYPHHGPEPAPQRAHHRRRVDVPGPAHRWTERHREQTVQQIQALGGELVDLTVTQKKNDIIRVEMRIKPGKNVDQLTIIGELEKLPWVLEVNE